MAEIALLSIEACGVCQACKFCAQEGLQAVRAAPWSDADASSPQEAEGNDALDALRQCEREISLLAAGAHTYASENADRYRGYDAGVNECLRIVRFERMRLGEMTSRPKAARPRQSGGG